MQGSFTARLEQVKGRTRCHRRGQLGRWKRECPRNKGSSGSTEGQKKSPAMKEMHIVEEGETFPDDVGMEAFLQEVALEVSQEDELLRERYEIHMTESHDGAGSSQHDWGQGLGPHFSRSQDG